MTLILTLLGNEGSGRTVLAIAAAKKLANSGAKVLLVSDVSNISLINSLGITPSTEPTPVANNLSAVQLSTISILEKQWEEVKLLDKKYLQSPVLQSIYGQELPVLPGMDDALILTSIREFYNSGKYDVIVYDGTGDIRTLRLLSMPEALSSYVRRFLNVINESDLGKVVLPFIQPLLGTILSSNSSWDSIAQNSKGASDQFLEKGKDVVNDQSTLRAYLVTTNEPNSLKIAKYLWGNAQLAGVHVAGVLFNHPTFEDSISAEFAPLSISKIPLTNDWQTLANSLPDLLTTINIPKPLEIDAPNNQIKVFLPGFLKKEVKLTQQGDTITLEAGEMRRNIPLTSVLKGKVVNGAKFQDGYLIISF